MRKTFRTLWFALSIVLISACSETVEEQHTAKTIRVTVGSGAKIALDCRTALEEDGFSIRWAKDDKIALWALDGLGNAALAAHTFSMYHYNATYGNAKFTADIPEMPVGEYTYCAVYPAPDAANVNGTQASFDIPATQDGTFNGRYDIMVAAADQPTAALQEGDNSDRVQLQFVHKVHLLQITIPENKLGDPITSLTLTFPSAVTGRLTVDATNPDAAPVLTNGNNVLTLNFATPKNIGDTVYAMIAPTTIADTENISIKAYSATRSSIPVNMFKEGFTGREFAAGHTTPIKLTVPELHKLTKLAFSIGTNNLGEAPQTITVTAPSGVTFPNGSQSINLAANNNQFVFEYEGDFTDNLSGKTFAVTYDSEHATVSNNYVMPTLTVYATNTLTPLTVPYLFEQNFNAATSGSSSVYDVSATSTDNTTTTESLSGYNLTNWSAARWSITDDKMLSTRCFARQTWITKRINVRGRIDSAPISGLKKSCSIKVTFDYKTSVTRNSSVGTFDGSVTGAIGYNSTGSAQNSVKYESGSDNTSTWNVSGPQTLSHSTDLKATSHTFSGFQNGYRLAWEVTGSGTITDTDGYYQLDIDNIKVSIAQ